MMGRMWPPVTLLLLNLIYPFPIFLWFSFGLLQDCNSSEDPEICATAIMVKTQSVKYVSSSFYFQQQQVVINMKSDWLAAL